MPSTYAQRTHQHEFILRPGFQACNSQPMHAEGWCNQCLAWLLVCVMGSMQSICALPAFSRGSLPTSMNIWLSVQHWSCG